METVCFGSFCLDPVRGSLLREGQPILMAPKAFMVLHYLLRHPEKLVTKDELLQAAWPKVCVGDGVLKVCIGEIRRALGDPSKQPRFIETVHSRGYRFIGNITRLPHSIDGGQATVSNGRVRLAHFGNLSPAGNTGLQDHSAAPVLGRDKELERLDACLARAFQGVPQVILIKGEAGIGKTTLIESFLKRATATETAFVAQGRCFEHCIDPETYFSVIEALHSLCRGPKGDRAHELLSQWAPTWAMQLPTVVDSHKHLPSELNSTVRQRMPREFVAYVEALMAEQPLVLVLEDLHWSDYATVDLISYLTHRRTSAPFIIIGSYRYHELLKKNHPLKALLRELKARPACNELSLGGLDRSVAQKFVSSHLPDSPATVKLSQILHEKTEGNPLFMVQMLDHWKQKGLFNVFEEEGDFDNVLRDVRLSAPESIRALVDQQMELLSDYDRGVLEAASIIGLEFSASAVATLLNEDIVAVENRCNHLAQHEQLLRPASSTQWPDRRTASRYSFIHGIYQQVLLLRIPTARRSQLYERTNLLAVKSRHNVRVS
ncbi:MAG: AAA family ATPase [Gammaproteobacteria bacterium]